MKALRRFQFSLRTFLVLLTFLGVALGWLGVQVKWIRDRHEALGKYSCYHSWVTPGRISLVGEVLPRRGLCDGSAKKDTAAY